jgi:GNAT superfamily N-acetyltransferase
VTSVRVARAGDVDAIARVHHVSFRAANGPALSPDALAELTLATRRSQWAEWLHEPPAGARILVAEAGGALVGVAVAGPARDDDVEPGTGELYALYVDPEAWGAGHGTALHDTSLTNLAEAGSREAILWALEGNAHARRFYAARGWAADGATSLFRGAAALRLRRAISA